MKSKISRLLSVERGFARFRLCRNAADHLWRQGRSKTQKGLMIQMSKQGLIHIYCGDGKGKTTAAIGLSIRALGRDYRVIFLQFLKWQETGEISVLKTFPNLTIIRGENLVHKFTWNLTSEEKEQLVQTHNEMFRHAISLCGADKCLLVMDELVGTYDMNLIDRNMVLDFLQHKP